MTAPQSRAAGRDVPVSGPAFTALEEALAAGTPGPWELDSDGDITRVGHPDTWVASYPSDRDGPLIVALRNAAPALLAEVRRLRAQVAAVEAIHVALHAWCVVCDKDRDVEALGNDPDCEHRASFCRACDTSWPCATRAALAAEGDDRG